MGRSTCQYSTQSVQSLPHNRNSLVLSVCTRLTSFETTSYTVYVFMEHAFTVSLFFHSLTLTYLCWAIGNARKYLLQLKDSVSMRPTMSACIFAVFDCVIKLRFYLICSSWTTFLTDNFECWVFLYFPSHNLPCTISIPLPFDLRTATYCATTTVPDLRNYWCWRVCVFYFMLQHCFPFVYRGTDYLCRKAHRHYFFAHSQMKYFALCLVAYNCHLLSLLWPHVRVN